MTSLRRHQKADTIKWIVVFVLVAALIAGLAVAFVQLDKQITTAKLRSTAFSIGTLDSNGEYEKNTGYIYTEDYITVDGLEITVAEDANVKYKVFYYSEDEDGEKTFISASTDWQTTDLVSSTIPEGADVARIVIQPVGDAEVSLLEIVGYANQVTVTYNK